jgi:hypothetical protein
MLGVGARGNARHVLSPIYATEIQSSSVLSSFLTMFHQDGAELDGGTGVVHEARVGDKRSIPVREVSLVYGLLYD